MKLWEALLNCHVKCSQHCLGKERAETPAQRFVLWRGKMPACALSFLYENQPWKVYFTKIKRKIIWGIQAAGGAEGGGWEVSGSS